MATGLKGILNDQASVQLGRLGYSDARVRAAKREGWWWFESRARALRRGKGLLRASAIVWTEPGRAECLPIEVPRAGRGEVSVEISTSVISAGTERAQYLRLPNALIGYPHRPGYSASGVVVDVGVGVGGVSVGDEVAVVGAAHASLVTVPSRAIFPVPFGASLHEAAIVQLGVICGQGVRRAEIGPGVEVCVVGAGMIGLLAQRLALAGGSGAATIIARSRSKETFARSGDTQRFLTIEDDLEEIGGLSSPIVIEATGDPDVLPLVVAAAGVGARIVLLGSPRGATRHFPMSQIRAKRLELVGAHVETLRYEELVGLDTNRDEATRFLGLLAEHRVSVEDLMGPRIDPREADVFYRRLVRDRGLLSAHFDWTALPAKQRGGTANFLRPPALRAQGVEIGRPVRLRRNVDENPFAGAAGMLRIGLVGCGDIAVHNARGIAVAPNARLLACYDPAAELAEDLARAHGADASPTLEHLLDRSDVDAVFIAVPHHLHEPLAVEAALAGKHVIVEKPLAHTLKSAIDLAAVVERAGVTLSVCFPHRYESSVQHARSLVAQGALGEFSGTLVNFFSEKPPSYWLGGFSGRAMSSWRGTREQSGGGVLIMNLSHLLDVIRYVTGAEVEQCAASMRVADGAADVEDTISLSLRYANGAVGTLMASSALRGHRGGKTELHMWGSDGYIVVEPELRVFTSRVAEDTVRTTQWQSFGRSTGVDIRATYVSRLASALERGDPPDVSVADALAVQAIIEAAYQSGDAGETVRPAELLAGVTT